MSGVDGFGTVFQRGNGATPEVFEALANSTKISPPGLKRETIDTTAHDTPYGWMTFIGGLRDGGEVSIDLNYDPGVHDELVADLDDPLPRNYRIVFPDDLDTTWNFQAVMTGFEPDAPYDDKLTASVAFKVSGKPTFS